MVVKYLENTKDALEKEKQALIQSKSSEVTSNFESPDLNVIDFQPWHLKIV